MNNQKILHPALNFLLLTLCGSLLASVLCARLHWIWQFDYPVSTDGFFYLQELKTRLDTGNFYYLKNSVFFTFWQYIGAFFGLSAPLLFKIIITSSLLIFSLAILVWLKDSALCIAVALLYVFWSSDVIFYRQYAFIKQGFSISVLFLALAVLTNSNKTQAFSIQRILGLILILFAALSHIFAAALTIIFSVFAGKELGLKIQLRILLATTALCFICYYLAENHKIIFASEYLFKAGWWTACEKLNCSKSEWTEFAIGSLFVLLASILAFLQRPKTFSGIFWVSVGLIIFLNLPIWTDEGDMMRRLAFSSMWVLFFLAAAAFSIKNQKQQLYFEVLIVCLALSQLCNLTLSSHKDYSVSRIPVEILENNIVPLKHWIPNDAFILAEHGLEFPMTYFLERSSSSDTSAIKDLSTYYHLRSPRSFRECAKLDNLHEKNDTSCILLNSRWAIYKIQKSSSIATENVK